MKHIILTFSFLATCIVVALAYQPMLVEGRQWNMYLMGGGYNPPYHIYPSTYYQTVGADTVIGGNTYKIIRAESSNVFCREDIAEQSVYIRRPNDETEQLLYKFNLNVNDTVEAYQSWTNSAEFVVTAIDEILGRKRIFVDNIALKEKYEDREDGKQYPFFDEYITNYSDIWIEGIGGLTEVGYRMYEIYERVPQPLPVLTCVYDNDILIFSTTVADSVGCTYIPPVADTWYGVGVEPILTPQPEYYSVELHLTEDTVINGTSFRKLTYTDTKYNYTDSCIGALRQTADGMKVYWHNLDTEYLLYDFSAEVGDTIKDAYFKFMDSYEYTNVMEENTFVGYLVESKEVVDGRIHLNISCCIKHEDGQVVTDYSTKWIQGIGTPNIIWPYSFGYVGSAGLWTLCVAKDNEILYSFDTTNLGIENNCPDWKLITDNVNNTPSSINTPQKQIIDGNLFILHNGKRYNLLGAEVK